MARPLDRGARGRAATTSRRSSPSRAARPSSRRPVKDQFFEPLPERRDHRRRRLLGDRASTASARAEGRDAIKGGPDGQRRARHRRARRGPAVVEPGSGVVGKIARSGQHPARLLQGPGEDRRDVRRARRHALRRCPATSPAIEADGTITLLGRGSVCINSGGEKIFPEEVEARAEVAPRRVRRGRRRRPGRALGSAGRRGGPGPGDAPARRRASCRRTAARSSPATRCPRSCTWSTRSPRTAERQARLPLGQGAGHDAGATAPA